MLRLLLTGLMVAGLTVTGLTVTGPASAPAAAAPAQNCAQPGENVAAVPAWPLAMLDAASVWPFTRGAGTTVAVLSTGVDAGHQQLRGRVERGFDATTGRGGADTDCAGTGTQVAGVIAAQPSPDSQVTGLAPWSTIMPVRVIVDQSFNAPPPSPDHLARGIEYAATEGADVIVIATPVYSDDRDLEDAVAEALLRGVVVIAAAGDLGGPDDGNPTPYPAAYDGVLGVGASTPDGQVWVGSQRGDYVDLTAPGAGVPTLQRGGGLIALDGTAIAAGYAGAAAALVRSKRGDTLPAEVGRLLIATAAPTARGEAYGAGVVSPYAAVSDQMVAPSARALPGMEPAPVEDTAAERRRRGIALAGGLLAACTVVAVLLAAAAIRRTRRQRWRPVRSEPIPPVDEPIEPGPPVMLLDEPADSQPGPGPR